MISWLFVLFCSLFYWSNNVSAQPGYQRLTNTEKRDGEPETLVDLANAEDNSIVGQLNAEIPVVINDRQKRLSDQRLAELQTLMRIQKINARLGAVTRGGRHVNALKVGRRKRSVFEMNMKNLRKLFKLSGQLGGYKGNLAFPAIS
ncbi:uncharacterized protein LOC117219782 isoform X2 [Megalopta genalis]|uniref:uncharacterized protein LOC117219782 isoform X2 n=1 Tax=Megalopta genalis TaxID=115081 RepID=UPI0014431969|nr:uncharacterized protein LOC117219782 [Megalopta genalis]